MTIVLLFTTLACDRSTAEGPTEERAIEGADAGNEAPSHNRSKRPSVDRDEQRRRSEAVRRAAEELAVRGVRTDGYLMNLIAEGDTYQVAFVRKRGRDLRREITVHLRRTDFEIISIDGDALTQADAGNSAE